MTNATPTSDLYVIEIVGLNNAVTPFDGQYLVEYDPEQDGKDPWGRPMSAVIRTTKYPSLARKFQTQVAAWEYWRKTCKRDPKRADGKPNRPLTAFTITVHRIGLLAAAGHND